MNACYTVLNRVTEQKKGLESHSPAFCVGEQLKAIAKASPKAAELIAGDLEKSGMGIADAEKKLKAYADELHAKQKGGSVCVPPQEADRILREFYGIPADEPDKPFEPVKSSGTIDLSDFF